MCTLLLFEPSIWVISVPAWFYFLLFYFLCYCCRCCCFSFWILYFFFYSSSLIGVYLVAISFHFSGVFFFFLPNFVPKITNNEHIMWFTIIQFNGWNRSLMTSTNMVQIVNLIMMSNKIHQWKNEEKKTRFFFCLFYVCECDKQKWRNAKW